MVKAAIEARNVFFKYRQCDPFWVLDGVSFAVAPGEYLLICGASGSGKSTLIKTFNGLIPHFYRGELQGEVQVAGRPVSAQTTLDLFGQVGMVFQNPETQLFNQTVEREIAFGLESLGLGRAIMRSCIDAIGRQVGISALMHRNPHELSGGEQQLVAIAAILALNPAVLVLDEPYASLDVEHVRKIRQLLKKIHAQGTTVIISEHRLAYTAPDATRMVVLNAGRVVHDGASADIVQVDLGRYGLEKSHGAALAHAVGVAKPDGCVSQSAGDSRRTDIKRNCSLTDQDAASKADIVLQVDHISYGTAAGMGLEDIDFTLHQGECLALVGANGAGKTTLLKLINGLLRPTRGRVLVKGLDTRQHKTSHLARHIGTAFQNPAGQLFKLRVADEIRVGPLILNCLDENWLDELVHLFKLAPLLMRSPLRLSGGEQRRVAFCAALASKPSILALDEPTAGQDGNFRRTLGTLIRRLNGSGVAVILATHDLAFVSRYSHRWIVLSQGKAAAQGLAQEMFKWSGYLV
jgi:energy-coupling factor transport system ATP-binding protein